MKKRIEEIDIMRGIAAISMILGHSFIVYPIDISSVPWCHWTQQFIYTFHMELFFVIAGIVYKCNNYKTFMLKKTKRILVPYLFFGCITLVLKAIGGAAINGNESISYGINKMIFYGGNYWFLYVLFLLFAIYPFIEKCCSYFKDSNFKAEIAVGIVVLIIRQFSSISSLFALSLLSYYIPYFIFGRIVGVYLFSDGQPPKISKRKSIPIFLASITTFICLEALEIVRELEIGAILSFFRAIAVMICIYFMVAYLCSLHRDHSTRAFTLIKDAGKYSLQLYLFNGFLLTAIRIIVCSICHITSPIVIVLSIWIGDIAISLFVCKLIIPHIPILRDLCGIGK